MRFWPTFLKCRKHRMVKNITCVNIYHCSGKLLATSGSGKLKSFLRDVWELLANWKSHKQTKAVQLTCKFSRVLEANFAFGSYDNILSYSLVLFLRFWIRRRNRVVVIINLAFVHIFVKPPNEHFTLRAVTSMKERGAKRRPNDCERLGIGQITSREKSALFDWLKQ